MFTPGWFGAHEPPVRLVETNRVDPLALTTDRFQFNDIEKALQMMQTKADGMIKPFISFI